jgi:hypothetical protein
VRPRGNSWALGAFVSADLDDSQLDPYQFRVYAHLCRRANDEQRAFPSIPAIAEKCQMSSRSVQRALAGLEELGFITREAQYRQDGSRTVDLIVLHGPQAPAPGDSQSPPPARRSPPGDSRAAHEGVPYEGVPSSTPPTPPAPAPTTVVARGEGREGDEPAPVSSQPPLEQPVPPDAISGPTECSSEVAAAALHLKSFFSGPQFRRPEHARHQQDYLDRRDYWLATLPPAFIRAVLHHARYGEGVRKNCYGAVVTWLEEPHKTRESIPAAWTILESHHARRVNDLGQPIGCPGVYSDPASGEVFAVEEVRDDAAWLTDGRVIVLPLTRGWQPVPGVAA